jgi:osmotically-inducible protein OsmY
MRFALCTIDRGSGRQRLFDSAKMQFVRRLHDDSEIRDKVISGLNAELWRPSLLNVTVHDGNVDLWGFVTSNDEKKAARIAVEGIVGVKSINDHLTIPPPETAMV